MPRISPFSAAALAASLVLAGCRDPEIRTYAAPKDVAPAAPGMAMNSPTAPAIATSAAPAIRWQLPPGWQDQGANNIRLGNILVTGPDGQRAEMTVTRFEGDVGGGLANVNRWRAQLQLPPIDEGALARTIQHADFPAGHMDIVELVSDAPLAGAKEKSRTLVAWLGQSDATWFFKLTGTDALVSSQRAAFDAFLKSVEFPPTSTNAPLPSGHPPLASDAVSTPPAPPASAVPPAAAPPALNQSSPAPGPSAPSSMAAASLPSSSLSATNALTWSAPAGWSEKPLGPVRKGSYLVREASGAEADLSITAFPGNVGGLLANLNRWRGELQLEPVTETDLPKVTTVIPSAASGLRFTLVDFAGNPGGTATRTIGAIVPVGDDTYFFKLKGPDSVVAGQKPAFMRFLETVKTR